MTVTAEPLLVTGTTVLGQHPDADALGMLDGRIVATGAELDVRRRLPEGVRTIDIPGGVIAPGLIDSHCHFEDAAMDTYAVALAKACTIEDALHAIAQFAHTTPAEQWIRGQGWNPILQLLERRAPTKAELDDAGGGRPVLLPEAHGATASTAAMIAAGIDPREHDGRFDRKGLDFLLTVVPPWTDEERSEQLLGAMRVLNRHGITSVVSGATTPRDLGLLRRLADERQSSIRVSAMVMPSGALNPDVTADEWSRLLKDVPMHRDRWMSVRGVKLQIDGGMTLGTAFARSDYPSRPGYRGVCVTNPETLRSRIEAAHTRGLPVGVHVVGDAAIDLALDELGGGDTDRMPDVLIHASLMQPDQIARAADLGVVVSAQVPFLWRNTPTIRSHFGPDMTESAVPFRDWIDTLGLHRVSAGTDHPVNDLDPFTNMYTMCERRDITGADIGANQSITRDEAFSLYTSSGAAHTGESAHKGQLADGMLADLTVLDLDPLTCTPEELRAATVCVTIVDGQVVHDARARIHK
ncbi:amidohydrolase [Rhodococcus erythropolis]|uniref:amidohydrolase n=1 Tax=Rhodococcus erythropolis TaxID=1833 RepID=UPI003013F98D